MQGLSREPRLPPSVAGHVPLGVLVVDADVLHADVHVYCYCAAHDDYRVDLSSVCCESSINWATFVSDPSANTSVLPAAEVNVDSRSWTLSRATGGADYPANAIRPAIEAISPPFGEGVSSDQSSLPPARDQDRRLSRETNEIERAISVSITKVRVVSVAVLCGGLESRPRPAS